MSSPYGGPTPGGPGPYEQGGSYGGPAAPGGGYGSQPAQPSYGQAPGGFGAQQPTWSGPAGSPAPGGPGAPAGPTPTGQGWGPPPAPKKPLDIAQLLTFGIIGLGVLSVIFGFFNEYSVKSTSGLGGGVSVAVSTVWADNGWLPALALATAVVAAGALLRTKQTGALTVAGLAVGGGLGAVFTLFGLGDLFKAGANASSLAISTGIGMILVLVFNLLQAIAAVVLLLTDVGVVKLGGGAARPADPAFGGAPQQGGAPHQAPAPQAPAPAPYGSPSPYGQSAPTAGNEYAPTGYPAPGAPSTSYAPTANPSTGSIPIGGSGAPYPSPHSPNGDDGQNPEVTQQVRF
jgi:hypothetical protein